MWIIERASHRGKTSRLRGPPTHASDRPPSSRITGTRSKPDRRSAAKSGWMKGPDPSSMPEVVMMTVEPSATAFRATRAERVIE